MVYYSLVKVFESHPEAADAEDETEARVCVAFNEIPDEEILDREVAEVEEVSGG